jgi:hypothetical protein
LSHSEKHFNREYRNMSNVTQWRILKRTAIYSILLLGILTCAFPEEQESCTVSGSSEIGFLVRCPDGSEAFIPPTQDGTAGPQGPAGPQGTAGKDGLDGVDGVEGKDGLDGKAGVDGAAGPQGPAGKDAEPCVTTSTNAGVYIQCSGGESAFIPNGLPGEPGPQGTAGEAGEKGEQGPAGPKGEDGQDTVMAVYDPCGDSPGFDEILLKLADGTVLAYFESGSNRFLTVLRPGTYRTTDGSNCTFTLLNDGTIQ